MDIKLKDVIDEKGKEIDFDEKSHTYTLKNGATLTSVTTMLKPYFPFDANKVAETLGEKSSKPEYAGKSKEEILKVWAGKRELGTRVHKFIEDYLNGEFVTVTCPREKAIYDYLSKHKWEDFVCEAIVFSEELQLAGTVDLLIKKNGKFYIVDFKTDERIDFKGFKGETCPEPVEWLPKCNFSKYKLQLGVYNTILSSKEWNVNVYGMKILHIKPNGWIAEYTVPMDKEAVEKVLEAHKKNLRTS